MKQKIYLHPMPIRVWHWINAVGFFVLIVTGLQIRYRDMLSFMTFRDAVNLHNIVGFVLVFNFFIWLIYYVSTGKIKIYLPPLSLKKFIAGCIRQAKYYGYGIFVGDENPHHSTPDNKFNPMQQAAYLLIMLVLMPVQIITGIFLWEVKKFMGGVEAVGGLKIVASVHMFIFLFFAAFLFVHIYLATLGRTPTEHIKAMFTGYEEVEGH